MTDDALLGIERELAVLARRTERFRAAIYDDGAVLDRSAYLLLSYLLDAGPVRLTTLGTVFSLDLSTISRQVAGMAAGGMVAREVDPTDRRATLVRLTDVGRERFLRTRARRLAAIGNLLITWTPDERDTFSSLLGRLNRSIDKGEWAGPAEREEAG